VKEGGNGKRCRFGAGEGLGVGLVGGARLGREGRSNEGGGSAKLHKGGSFNKYDRLLNLAVNIVSGKWKGTGGRLVLGIPIGEGATSVFPDGQGGALRGRWKDVFGALNAWFPYSFPKKTEEGNKGEGMAKNRGAISCWNLPTKECKGRRDC